MSQYRNKNRDAGYRKFRDLGDNETAQPQQQDNAHHTSVITLQNGEHKTRLLASNTVVCLDIWATWCQPCKAIAPGYDKLADKYTYPGKCVFAKENVDMGLSPHVTAIPHLEIYKEGKKVYEINGGNLMELEQQLQRFI